jgi:hypothetical protein
MDPTLSAALAAAVGNNAINSGLIAGATIEQLQKALVGASSIDVPGVFKAGTYTQSGSATSGLTAYDLEAPAKLLYPVLTPLRNMIPRVAARGGIQAAWRAITSVNSQKLSSGVSEGNRGAVVNVTTQDYIAAYRGLGFESNATFEGQYSAEGFDDVRARAATAGLHSLMLDEERVMLGGNGTMALGTTPTPSLTASGTGGSLATSTQSVICIALTQEGFYQASVAAGVVPTYNRSNADGSSDTLNGGTARKSTNATVAVTGPNGSVTSTVTAVRGAMAYAWFWGLAGSEVIGAITTAPKLVITAVASGTQTAASVAAVDTSINGLIYDGLLTQALKSGSGAYWADLGGATLTSDAAGGVNEINTALKDRWDNYRLNPDTIWVSSQQAQDITTKVIAGGGTNAALRFNVDIKQGMVAGGTLVTSYLNRFGLNGATELKIRQHPNLVPGTILMTTSQVPYPLSDVGNVMQMRMRQDYYQIEWPWRSRKYEYGIYADGVLQHFFPPSMVVITGIAAG